MIVLRFVWGFILLGLLVVIVQLDDTDQTTPEAQFRRLPDGRLLELAEAEVAAGRQDHVLLLLDYAIENKLGDPTRIKQQRSQVLASLLADKSALGRLKAIGWTPYAGAENAFANLASVTVADAVLHGEIAALRRQGLLEMDNDPYTPMLEQIAGISSVFPPAEGAVTIIKAAQRAGAINTLLSLHLSRVMTMLLPDSKSAASVEIFRENFMPVLELARYCRSWTEFQVILQQADTPDQVKVLTKIIAGSPGTSKRLSQVLVLAGRDGQPGAMACLDLILRQGQSGLTALHAAAVKGAAGLKFAVENPRLPLSTYQSASRMSGSSWASFQEKYQNWRQRHGAVVTVIKYLVIAELCALMVLAFVPGEYLERLISSASSFGPRRIETGVMHHFMVAFAVGAVLSALTYVFSMAIHPASDPVAAATAGDRPGGVSLTAKNDSALLSGTVVLFSLLTHALIWFWVRSKLRRVEEDTRSDAGLRLRRLENLDLFLDLPLFAGLALTVIAFILITFDAGMSRHFAYTSTVVGILSAVSLRIRYLYPLKERLIQSQRGAVT